MILFGFDLKFILITSYMVITYHIIALKYKKSRFFRFFSIESKLALVSLHIFIVLSNILLYFWLIMTDYQEVHIILRTTGILIFGAGLFIIFWSGYSLKRSVFIPENKLITKGPYSYVRHPMYFGGIIGAIGLALLRGSIHGLIYSFFLAVVLSRIAGIEEDDLRARFGSEYEQYKKNVPKLFPHFFPP